MTSNKRHKKFGSHEIKFFEYFDKVKLNVHLALKNNIDTPSVIKLLHELVSSSFTYVTIVESSEPRASEEIIRDAMRYVKSILDEFGLDDFDDKNHSNDGKELELVKVVQNIRTEMRDISKDIGIKVKPLDKKLSSELQQSIYKLTDSVRDQMESLGFPLTDK